LPRLKEYLNWDHPDAVNSRQLQADLASLKQGQSAEITQKDSKAKQEYDVWEPRRRVRVDPKGLVILEGFLALHYPELRELYDYSIYLDAPFDTHLNRRVHFMTNGYRDDVLKDMHHQYMEPSKLHADLVVDAAHNDQQAVLRHVLLVLQPLLPEVTTV
jgi:uridine kinase